MTSGLRARFSPCSGYHSRMRLFTAIELDDAVREHVAEVVDALGAIGGGVRWTRPENLHITLKFIGEMDDAAADGLRASLRALRMPPMLLRCDRLLFFPPRGGGRIVAAGVGGDAAALAEVFDIVDEICATAGLAREKRAYRPHVTLGRCRDGVRGPQQRQMIAATAGLWPGPALQPPSVALLQSILAREGAHYHVIERFA